MALYVSVAQTRLRFELPFDFSRTRNSTRNTPTFDKYTQASVETILTYTTW